MSDILSGSEGLLKSVIEELHTDILFECFAGLLIRAKAIEENNLHVVPKENHKRNYNNDILPFANKETEGYEQDTYFEESIENALTIYTSRSAILNYLPEDLYIMPDEGDYRFDENGKARTPAEIKFHRQQIRNQLKSAVKFFRPIEIECNKIRIRKEVDHLDKLENSDQMLQTFWGQSAANEQMRRFLRTLHLVSFCIGDKVKTKALIEFVLDTDVLLEFSIEEYCEVSDSKKKELNAGGMVLGFNVVIGNSFYDYLDVVHLTISNLSIEVFFEYFNEASERRKLLDEIVKHYFPINVEVRLDFSITPETSSEKEEFIAPILGYSTKLGG